MTTNLKAVPFYIVCRLHSVFSDVACFDDNFARSALIDLDPKEKMAGQTSAILDMLFDQSDGILKEEVPEIQTLDFVSFF